jgi:hypothetical protein
MQVTRSPGDISWIFFVTGICNVADPTCNVTKTGVVTAGSEFLALLLCELALYEK